MCLREPLCLAAAVHQVTCFVLAADDFFPLQ